MQSALLHEIMAHSALTASLETPPVIISVKKGSKHNIYFSSSTLNALFI